ncbi:MAG: hypothetical protein C4522_06670 [Desulfobacteraceae bacterium]|nr:MAG: hypothetical protein C4522_06670 [Desulfobacteraceae bacterium]
MMGNEKRNLPVGWSKTTLGDIAILRNEKVDPLTIESQPYISLEHIDSGINHISSHGMSTEVKSLKSVFFSGDVLYGKLRPYLNKVCQPHFDGVCSTDILVFQPSLAINNNLLLRYLSRRETVEYANRHSKGINLPRISPNQLGKLIIYLPPLNEQKRIVAKIEELQARSSHAREALESIPDLLEQLRQSILAAAFRGNLTKAWRKEQGKKLEPASDLLKRIRVERRKRWEEAELTKLKAKGLTGENLDEAFAKQRKKYKEPTPLDTSGLPELPEGWCWEKMDNICIKVMDGAHHSPPNGPSGDRMYITAKNVRPWRIDLSNITYISEDEHQKIYSRCDVQYNDILYVKDGVNAGMASLNNIKEPFSLLSSVGVYRPEKGLISEYAVAYLNSPLGHRLMLSMVSGNAITRLTLSKLKESFIPIPSIDEQRAICKLLLLYLDKLNSLQKIYDEKLSSLHEFDQSILSKAFRGELVPQDPNNEPASILLERIRQEKVRLAETQKSKTKQKGKKMKRQKTTQQDIARRIDC